MGASSSSYTKPADIPSKHFPAFLAALPSLQGKAIAITGTTSGTGFVAALACAQKGAHVFLLNRPSPRATAAEQQLQERAPGGTFTAIPCDLASFASVRAAAAALTAQLSATGLDVLCCNAGVMALADEATADGYDVQMQTNHLSHFLLTREAFPLLQRAAELRGQARIVHHSSGARKFPSAPLCAEHLGRNGGALGGNSASMLCGGARWQRYHQTKLANAVCTLALRDRLQARHPRVLALCAAPGLAATNLQVTTHAQGGMSETWIMRFAQSAEDGTMPLLMCMAGAGVQSGELYEPAGMTGPAVRVSLDAEALCASPASRALLWEESCKACGGAWEL
jgi:NAD(P)-dependent dehydrogenase (short-subunit alcohol dehydrogenase family)